MISLDEQLGRRGAGGDAERGDASNCSQGISAARCTSSALAQPARSATSTRRSELELLGAPTTISRSQRAAIALTASWRLVVA